MDDYTTAPRPPNAMIPNRSLGHHPAMSRTWFMGSSDAITQTRDDLDEWLQTEAPQLDGLRIYEIVLAANELLCNAFEHGAGGCHFTMARQDAVLMLQVANPLKPGTHATHDSIAALPDWTMPSGYSRSGRGLAIVKNVADSVHLAVADDRATITATFDLEPKTHVQPKEVATLAL